MVYKERENILPKNWCRHRGLWKWLKRKQGERFWGNWLSEEVHTCKTQLAGQLQEVGELSLFKWLSITYLNAKNLKKQVMLFSRFFGEFIQIYISYRWKSKKPLINSRAALATSKNQSATRAAAHFLINCSSPISGKCNPVCFVLP